MKYFKYIMEQIEGYEGLYEIHLNGPNGLPAVWSIKKNIYLKPQINTSSKYYTVGLYLEKKRQIYSLHGLVASHFINNPDDLSDVDHIDCDRLNPRIQNLRWLSRSHNHINKKSTKGYCLDKRRGKWMARIGVNKKQTHLGYFTEEEDAREAYLEAKKKYYPDI